MEFLDITYSKVPTDIYSILELALGIMCACLPIMRPIISRALPTFQSRGSLKQGDKSLPPIPKRFFSRGFERLNEDGGYGLANIAKSRGPECTVSAEVARETVGGISVTREWDVERQ